MRKLLGGLNIQQKNRAGCEQAMKWWSIAFMIILAGVACHMAFLDIAGADGPIGSRLTPEEMGTLNTLHNKARADVGVRTPGLVEESGSVCTVMG